MTLSLTSLQSSSRRRVLWGATIITTLVPNRHLGFDVLAIEVEGYSNSAVFSTVPVPTKSQHTDGIGRPSVAHSASQSHLKSAEQLAAKLVDIILNESIFAVS